MSVPFKCIHDCVPKFQPFQRFLFELNALLKRLGLTETLSLCAFTSEDVEDTHSAAQMELTQGLDNVASPFHIVPEEGENRSIQAVWQFDVSTPAHNHGNRK
jgi:hypothetical protein